MAYAQVAARAAQAAVKYGPQVASKAGELLSRATGGRVTSVADVPKYVGTSVQRLSVATGALARAGIQVQDLIPEDLSHSDAKLQQIRATLLAQVGTMQSRFDSGSDRSLGDGLEGDIIRKRRVQAAMRIYGSEETYFLCHPNGGIPRDDFTWYKSLFGR